MTDAERDSKYLADKLVTMGVLTRFQANDVEKVLEDYLRNGIPVDELPEEISDDLLIPNVNVGDWVRIVDHMDDCGNEKQKRLEGSLLQVTAVDGLGFNFNPVDGIGYLFFHRIAEVNPPDHFEMHHNYSEDHVKGESVMHPYPAQKDQWPVPDVQQEFAQEQFWELVRSRNDALAEVENLTSIHHPISMVGEKIYDLLVKHGMSEDSTPQELEWFLSGELRRLENLEDRIKELQEEVDVLKGEIHECPKCGETCKQCLCVEKEMERLRKSAGIPKLGDRVRIKSEKEMDAKE